MPGNLVPVRAARDENGGPGLLALEHVDLRVRQAYLPGPAHTADNIFAAVTPGPGRMSCTAGAPAGNGHLRREEHGPADNGDDDE